jgi:hypothetical protein
MVYAQREDALSDLGVFGASASFWRVDRLVPAASVVSDHLLGSSRAEFH